MRSKLSFPAFLSISLLLILGGTSPAHGFIEFNLPDAQPGSVNVQINEIVDGNSGSRREAVNFATGESWLCPEMPYSSGPCNFETSGLHFYGSNLLPACKTARQENCIEGLSFQNSQGQEVRALYLGNAGGTTFPAVPRLGIYPGGQISLWSVPGFSHGGQTDSYAVAVRSRQGYEGFTKKYVTTSLDAAVVPYSVEAGDYQAPQEFLCGEEGKSQVCGGKPDRCFWTDTGLCGVRQSFTESPTISLKVRMSNQIGGWFRGRLSDASISVKSFSGTNNLVTISGKPVEVSRFAATVQEGQVSKKGLALLEDPWSPKGDTFKGGRVRGAFATDGWKQKPFDILDEFRDAANDTADSVSTLWNFETVDKDSGNSCLADTNRVLGLVTTNATVYDGTAPTFRNGILRYQVSGMHYLPGGKELSLGSYDLVMRSDVARCLYGFGSVPLSAQVSVVNDSGEKSLATTVVSEKAGWLKMAASGFTFSSKTVRVKITKAKPVKIACVSVSDDSKVKNVRAINPKCPKGFRRA